MEQKKLNITVIERVFIADVGSLFFDKENIVKRNYEDYETADVDGVRLSIYTLVKDQNEKFDFALTAKCIKNGEKQTKHYLIKKLTTDEIENFILRFEKPAKVAALGGKSLLSNFLSNLTSKNPNFKDRKFFEKFMDENYNIKL